VAELVAYGGDRREQWRRPLEEGTFLRLGRSPDNDLIVAWESAISRSHAHLQLLSDQLHVRCGDSARNAFVYEGTPQREFTVRMGDEFSIGDTSFRLMDAAFQSAESARFQEHSFGPDEIRSFQFNNAEQRLEAVTRLPRLMAESKTDEEFANRMVDLLLQAIPVSDAAAVIAFEIPDEKPTPEPGDITVQASALNMLSEKPRLMRWSSRTDIGRFRPSRRLIQSAILRKESILNIWTQSPESAMQFTQMEGQDWAFCTPIPGETCRGWVFYMTGKFKSMFVGPDELRSDMRFTDLLAQFIGANRQVRTLENRQAQLRQFFSPAIIETLNRDAGDQAMQPREKDITVLFCDVRGFSRRAEESQQNLIGFLGQISTALSVMSRAIRKNEGVIAHFAGDAALAFWGWPADQPDGPVHAARTALEIMAEFDQANRDPAHPLHGFQIGIGMGHGKAVAGKIGTEEQSQVSVFGPVVNVASRLEAMTKRFRTPILMDETSAAIVAKRLPPAEGRSRRIAKVQPKGMEVKLFVHELLPPASNAEAIPDEHLLIHEVAIDAFITGKWSDALAAFGKLPDTDLGKTVLIDFMKANSQSAPKGWTGTIILDTK
jgi:adenylate cyclase